jgi:hypothetical protein
VCYIAHYAISSGSRHGCLVFGGQKVERHRAEVNGWLQRHAWIHLLMAQKLISVPTIQGRGREFAKSNLIDFEIGIMFTSRMHATVDDLTFKLLILRLT